MVAARWFTRSSAHVWALSLVALVACNSAPTVSPTACVIPCSAQQKCVEGICVDLQCVPDQRKCVDDQVFACGADGRQETLAIDCGADGMYCRDGRCEANRCNPACRDDEYCDDTRTCQPTVCVPGERRCDGEDAVVCNADGSRISRTSCAPQLCVQGACVPPLQVDVDPVQTVECAGTRGATVSAIADPRVRGEVARQRLRLNETTGATVTLPRFFPLGSTRLWWDVEDRGGHHTFAEFDLNVVDSLPPQLVGGPPLVAEATDPAGTPLSVTPASALDLCLRPQSPPVLSDAPARFDVGTTTVTFTAMDPAGQTATATRAVVIVDTTAPTVTASAAFAVGHDGAGCFAYAPPPLTARDNADRPEQLTQTWRRVPDPGRCWALGTHRVDWTVTDRAGNVARFTQTVEVRPSTLRLSLVHIEVASQVAQEGRFYNQPVTVVFDVTGGAPPYSADALPRGSRPVQDRGNGRFAMTVSDAGVYDHVLALAASATEVGSARLTVNFGVDLTPPVVVTDITDQRGVNPSHIPSYAPLFDGERLRLERIYAHDGAPALDTLGAGLGFEGQQQVTVPASAALSPAAMTIHAWVRPRASGGTIAGTDTWRLGFDGDHPQVRLTSAGTTVAVRGATVARDRWHAVAATLDGVRLRLWVDGRPAATTTVAPAVMAGASSLRLGQGLTGDLAEVTLRSSVMSEDDLAELYLGGLGAPARTTPDTVALYRFAGTGQTVDDATSQHHGVLGVDGSPQAADPTRLTLAPPSAPEASGVTRLTFEVVAPLIGRQQAVAESSNLATGQPLQRGARALGDLRCGRFTGAPCNTGARILEADELQAWAVAPTALILRVRATDAAGNTTTHDLGVLPFGFVGALDDVLNRWAVPSPPLVRGHRLASHMTPHVEGGYLAVQEALGQAPHRRIVDLTRATDADAHRYLSALTTNQDPLDRPVWTEGQAIADDARFFAAMGRPVTAVATSLAMRDHVARLHPAWQGVRTSRRSSRSAWSLQVRSHLDGVLRLVELRTSAQRSFAHLQTLARSRMALSTVVDEMVAVRSVTGTGTPELEAALDILVRASADPAEQWDVVAPLGSPYPGCLDRLSQLNISDEGLFRCFFRLRDLAMTLKATPRREFDADRWRAMTVIAMCGVWDFVITGREGLAFQNPATTQLWHPDAPGALPTDVAAAYQGYQACDPTRSYEDAYRDLVALCPTARAIYNTYYAGLFPPLPASVCP